MTERHIPIQKAAQKLRISVEELEEMCENRQIPFIVTDPGTAWEAKRFYLSEVFKAVGTKKKTKKKEEPL